MVAIFEHRHLVLPGETDRIGHASNLAYVQWLLDAAVAHAAVQGWPTDRHLQLGSGWVVRSHHIDYLRPAFAGDQLVVRTWVAGFKRISSVRRYQIVRPADDQLLVRAETNWAYVRYDSHLPTRIPPEVIRSFEIVSGDDEPQGVASPRSPASESG